MGALRHASLVAVITLASACLGTSPLGVPDLESGGNGGGDGDGDGDACSGDEVLCGAQCADLQVEEGHCGQCFNRCGPSEGCQSGSCVSGCASPGAMCDGVNCYDLETDRSHCGACGNECGPEAYCDGGQCTCGSDGWLWCNGQCVFADGDANNCGACGRTCETVPNAFTLCTDGACEIAECDVGLGDCDGLVETGCETGIMTDPFNCGGCGIQCPTPLCTQGRCGDGAGGYLITNGRDAYGHHGACEGWNGCRDADTCALWACQYRGFMGLVSWGRQDICGNFDECYLFNDQRSLDEDWGNGDGCNLMGVGDIVCF